ncbi:hypothetical protein Tco_1193989 [Tanacetum coccineum]
MEEDKESGELKQCLEIVLDDGDDVTIDATPLSTKSPTIVDYKIHKEGKKSFFQIIRADGKHHMYLTFGKMLKNFDREDLEVLWSIVKARFKKTEPVNYMDNFLPLNLKTMFEHHVKDNNILFYLLVEKMYPLTKYTLHQMFNDVKLQVDYECKMLSMKKLEILKENIKFRGGLLGLKDFMMILKLLLLSADSSPSKIARNNGQTLVHTTARIGHLEVISFIPSYDVAKMRLRFVGKPWLTYCECDIGTT